MKNSNHGMLIGLVFALILALGIIMPYVMLESGAMADSQYKWAEQETGTLSTLSGVSALDADNVWAVGDDGTILHYDGKDWSAQESGTIVWLRDVSALDANNVWAVGYGGTILHYNGTAWSAQVSGTTDNLYGVSALDANNVWAVGSDDDGTVPVLHYNGTAWSAQESGILAKTNCLYGVSALDANSVWAVGNYYDMSLQSIIYHFDGADWTEQGTRTANGLWDVSALDANNVWAVGEQGTIRYYNGAGWSEQESGFTTGGKLWGVSALDANKVWAVGDTGTILYFDGTGWSEQASGTNYGLWDVSALDANNVWAVGQGGTILHGSPAATTWYLAEGSTDGGMETFVLVQNPNDDAVTVDLTFMTSTGPQDGPQGFAIPANSRQSFKVNDYVTDYNVSTMVNSWFAAPIICERAMYGNNRTWAHDSVGYSER